MAETLRGMQALLSLFDTLPKATEQEIKEDLPKIGAQVLAAQRQAAPVGATGDLSRGLTTVVLNAGWKIRVGLMNLAAKAKSSLYYGRFVEFGRRSQVVRVERRRRVRGRLRLSRGRKRAEDIVSTYSMKVRAMPSRPFVNSPAADEAALDGAENLAAFWDNVLARAGGSE